MTSQAPAPPERLLEALPLPLLLFGADRTLRFVNSAFLDIWGVPAEHLPRGMPLLDCARVLAYRGMLGAGDPEDLAARATAADRTRPARRLIRMLNGRAIDVHSAPTGDGGFVAVSVDVTALVTAQGEAAAEARRLAEVVSALGTGVAAFGPDLRLRLANTAYGPLIGLPATQVRDGTPAAEIVRLLEERGEFAAEAPDLPQRLLERISDQPVVLRRRRPTGQTIESCATRLSDGGLLIEVSDVTARQDAEDEARRRAALLDSILEALPAGVCVFDADLRVTKVNRAHRTLMKGADAAIGDRLPELLRRQAARGDFGGADVESLIRHEVAFRSGPSSARVLRRADGRVLSNRIAPLPDGGHVSVVTDISAVAAAEADAKAQAARLSDLIERLPFGVALFDADRRLVAVNAAALRLGGLDPAEVPPGTPLERIFQLQIAHGEYTAEEQARGMAADRRKPLFNRRIRPDGTVLDMQSLPMPDGGFLSTFQDVTRLVEAEQEARAQAAMQRAMIDNTDHGVLLFGPDERLVALNAAARRIEDYPPDVVLEGLTRDQVLAHVRRTGGFASVTRPVEGILAARANEPRAYRRTRADGRVVDVAVRPMPGGGFTVNLTDVTRLVAAEAAASARAEMLRGILDNIPTGIFLYDAEGRLVACNAAALALTGLSEAEAAPGTRQVDLLRLLETRGELPDGLPIADRVADAEGRRPLRYTRRRPDGTILDVSRAAMPDGGFVVTLADVTRLSRAEAEARSRAAIQAAMLDNMRHGIALFDAEHRMLASNPLAARLTGVPPEAFHPGASVESLRDAQIAAGEYTAEQAAARGHDGALRAPQRYVRERPDGSVIEVTTDSTPDGLFVRTYADVTEDRRVRADLEAARREAEAALAAKSRFLATMTHELRTPLNAVIGFAELLQTPLPAPERAEFAGMIADAGRELLGLIDQILDVARSETAGVPVQTGRVELGPVLDQAAAAKRAAATAAGVAFSVVLPPDLPDAEADAARLGQVVQGLLSNAIKFTPAGGRVTLSACVGVEGGVAVQVSDTGIGISPDALPRVFEPFAQLDAERARRYAGSGIGLYLARSIADAMGMRLALDSRQGEGTTATLLIPPERCLPPDEESA